MNYEKPLFFKRPGGQLAYYQSGTEGSPVLFIHGLGSSSRDWEYQFPEFQKNHRCYSIDLRGHGNSSRNWSSYTIREFGDDLASFIETVIKQPVHAVGVSMGGMVSYELATRYQHLLYSAVIVNVLPEFGDLPIRKRLKLGQRILLLKIFGMNTMARYMSPKLFPKENQQKLREHFIERWSENDTKIYIKCVRSLIRWSVKEQMQNIKLPVLVITGDRDYVSPETHVSYIKLLQNARLKVIEDSGHATPVDQPESFNRAVLEFIESHS